MLVKKLPLDIENYSAGLRVWQPLWLTFLYSLVVLSLSRIVLLIWQIDRVEGPGAIMYILLQGLRVDISTLGALLLLPALLNPLLNMNVTFATVFRKVNNFYFLSIFALILFMELATPTFIGQFDTRPNIWFIEYLAYPREIGATVIAAYKLPLILALIVVVILTAVLKRALFRIPKPKTALNWKIALASMPVIIVIFFIAIRSSTGHRPLNPAKLAFSSDSLVNSLPLNSSYSVLYAFWGVLNESKMQVTYGKMEKNDVIREVQNSMYLNSSEFINQKYPSLHVQHTKNPELPSKNLIIVLEESLGAEFVGALGGLKLTPFLDNLSEQGLWFENMYATGTRSVRGIEAVVSGFLPTSAQSVVKRPASQQNFFTLGRVLSEKGYDTSFIYGGEAHFDNMRAFFANNGFNRIIEHKDYSSPVFDGAWGVSDEDLFNKADEYFREKAEKGQAFFSLVFTSSNHEPFQFPENRITLYEQPKETVNNAVKYADYALGQFINKLKASSYYDNTLVLIVADHNSRVYGAEYVPVERFHIPALILSKDLPQQKVTRITSQIDLIPTLVSLMNITVTHPVTGIDITRDDIANIPSRAIMQYDQVQAYMEGNNIVVFRAQHDPLQFEYINGSYLDSREPERALLNRALGTALWPNLAYQEGFYQVDH